jgi:malate synthase
MNEIKVLGPIADAQQASILSAEALNFLAALQRSFNARRLELLAKRQDRQRELDAGRLPNFLPETAFIRQDPSWQGPKPAPGIIDRRVEITGPVDRKMVINALNSGATQFMADFEGRNKQHTCTMAITRIYLYINKTLMPPHGKIV